MWLKIIILLLYSLGISFLGYSALKKGAGIEAGIIILTIPLYWAILERKF